VESGNFVLQHLVEDVVGATQMSQVLVGGGIDDSSTSAARPAAQAGGLPPNLCQANAARL